MKIDDAIQSKFPSPQIRALINVRYTANYLSGIQNTEMAKFGVSMAQFNILRILRGAKDSLAVNTVKERMIEKSPNTTRLMDKLIDKKLISRERCEEDRRVVYVKITNQGLELLLQIDEDFERNKSNVFFTALSDEESDSLSDLLDKLRESVES